MERLSPPQLAAWLKDAARPRPLMVDVREPWEVQTCRIGESLHLPLNEIPARFNELDAARDIVLICHHGARSLHAAMFLERQGFTAVWNLDGGVDGWARSVDPSMPVY